MKKLSRIYDSVILQGFLRSDDSRVPSSSLSSARRGCYCFYRMPARPNRAAGPCRNIPKNDSTIMPMRFTKLSFCPTPYDDDGSMACTAIYPTEMHYQATGSAITPARRSLACLPLDTTLQGNLFQAPSFACMCQQYRNPPSFTSHGALDDTEKRVRPTSSNT
ncbi:hypothetical protein BDW22DRAFT_784777 [Trametopsis cervina]|nr:hypothetical protein BDW22DRAFT_784777 [Trametopsis cervina]